MALLSVPVIFRALYTFGALPSLATCQTLILMSGEGCLVYSFVIVASVTPTENSIAISKRCKTIYEHPKNAASYVEAASTFVSCAELCFIGYITNFKLMYSQCNGCINTSVYQEPCSSVSQLVPDTIRMQDSPKRRNSSIATVIIGIESCLIVSVQRLFFPVIGRVSSLSVRRGMRVYLVFATTAVNPI